VAATAPGSAGRTGRQRHDRLVTRSPGRSIRQGKKGGGLTGPSPVDRGKPGSKIHALSDRAGLPLTVGISAANTHDSHALKPLVNAIPAIRSRRGPRRRKPAKLHADKAYDIPALRAWLRRRGIIPRIARKGIESSDKLGKHRWVIERTMCAARRSVVSPVQPGGTWREVPGSNGLPEAERLGDKSMPGNPATGSSGQGRCVGGTRVIWRKLDCLKPNLQSMQVPIRRKDC
jgi:transposase